MHEKNANFMQMRPNHSQAKHAKKLKTYKATYTNNSQLNSSKTKGKQKEKRREGEKEMYLRRGEGGEEEWKVGGEETFKRSCWGPGEV